jgi:lipid-A-disaccharide synthase
VGHPLLERIDDYKLLSRTEFYNKFNLDPTKEILLILPGSRKNEITRILPEAVKAAGKLMNEFNLQTIVACSNNIDADIFKKQLGGIEIKVIKGHNYDLMNLAKIGIIKSGTSTLEAALFSLPMVIVYKTSLVTYLIGRKLIKLDTIGMANIIAGEKIVPELIQNQASAQNIYKECRKILSDKELYSTIRKNLALIKSKLGSPGASHKAAQIICSALNEI